MSTSLKRLLLILWLPVTILLLWWFASAGSTSFFFPPLQTIATAFKEEWLFARVPTDLLPSLGRFGLGYLIACATGLALGIVIGLSRVLQRALTPLIDFLRAIPPPAVVPLAMLALGLGNESKIVVIAFGATFPILLNVIDGARGVDPLYLDVGRVFQLSTWQRIRSIVLPSIVPNFFTGARLGMAIALILMVVTEMIGSTNGLGYSVLYNQQNYAIPEMWAGIVMIGIIGFIVNQTFVFIERRTLAWYRGWKGHVEMASTRPAKPKRATTLRRAQ